MAAGALRGRGRGRLSSPDWPEPAPSKEDCPGHTGEVMRCGCFLGTRFPPPTAPALPEAPG